MRRNHSPKTSILVLLALLPLGAACSSATPAVAPEEAARVQSYIAARYTAADVRHSFRTQFGEDIDCIDFEAQSSVKALRAQGVQVPPPPPAAPLLHPPTADDVFFTGYPDENGSPRSCPQGTVPQVRLTSERIAHAGGLDAYLRASHDKAAPLGSASPQGCPATQNYAWVTSTVQTSEPINAGGTTMAVYKPTLPTGAFNSHSLSEAWLVTGTGSGCAGSSVQSIEVGWHVHDQYEGDYNTHLFIFATNDGYATTGCYNNDDKPGYGGPATCLPFVLTSSVFTPGMTLTASTLGSTSVRELTTTTSFGELMPQDPGPNAWFLTLSATGIAPQQLGYYPASDFTGGLRVGEGATYEVGGEVEDNTGQVDPFTSIQMGSGNGPELGIGDSAYHHDVWALTQSGRVTALGGWYENESLYYQYAYPPSSPPGAAGWSNFFFYGGGGAPYCLEYPNVYPCNRKLRPGVVTGGEEPDSLGGGFKPGTPQAQSAPKARP
jgi:hypothetical protein